MQPDISREGAGNGPAATASPAKPPPAGFVVTGEGLRRAGDPRILSEGPPCASQVFVATVYLKRAWAPAKTAVQGSYWLKHEVERHAGLTQSLYVANGALIQAALDLGLRVSPDFCRGSLSVNALIFVKRPKNWPGPWCERDGCNPQEKP